MGAEQTFVTCSYDGDKTATIKIQVYLAKQDQAERTRIAMKICELLVTCELLVNSVYFWDVFSSNIL